MKRYLFAIILLAGTFLAATAMAQEQQDEFAEMTFQQSTKDLGDIVLGDSIQYTFYFTNTGTIPLQIKSVITTCSCTSREYTRTAVEPGAEGFVKVTFNSGKQQKTGRHNKAVTILSNAINSPERVILSCNVLPAR